MNTSRGLPIGALSAQSGVNIETIRYYEKIGVMPKPIRSAGGFRIYGSEHVKRLHFVRRGRELGFSLDELRGLLRLVDGHAYTCAEVHALTVAHLGDIRRKISDLRRLQRVMSEMAAQCTADQVPECPVIDALFDARPLTSHAVTSGGMLRETAGIRGTKTTPSTIIAPPSSRRSRR